MKKQIPLELIEIMQPLVNSFSDAITPVREDSVLYKLIDRDRLSDFYFEIIRQERKEGKLGYIIGYKPQNKAIINEYTCWVNLDSIPPTLKNWYDVVDGYNSYKTVHDDPILQQYEEEFYKDFKIVDVDAKHCRFDFAQQLVLIEYLEKVEEFLEEAGLEMPNEVGCELLEDVKQLKREIAVENKNAVIRRLSRLWGKFRKHSIKACNFVINEFAKEVIKEAAKKGINMHWEQLPNYIQHAKDLLS
jgi:hypothetical protein